MKNLTERGYSLLFVFFLIRKCGTVFLTTFPWYSSQRIPRHVDIRKVFVHQCRAVRWRPCSKGPASVFVDDVGSILVNFKVVASPGDVDMAEQIVAEACDSVSSRLSIVEPI